MQKESICIICFGNENIKKNKLCYNKCNFFYHENCYIEWQKTKTQRNATCILCKEPILNFITGEVSLINPLVRHNNVVFNTTPPPPPPYPPPPPATNTNENEEGDTRGMNDACIKKTLMTLLVTMLVLITLTFILALI